MRKNPKTSETEVLLQEIQSSRRKGLWGFPESSKKLTNTHKEKADYRAKYAITKYKVDLFATVTPPPSSGDEPKNSRWLTLEETEELAVAAPYRKVLNWLKTYKEPV